jgi:uncharacterized integral membrane protein
MTMRSSDDDYSWEEQPSTAAQVRRFGPAAVIAIVALLFVLQNTESTTFEFLWFDFEMPKWVMLVVFAGVGAVVLYGLQLRRRRRRKSESTD